MKKNIIIKGFLGLATVAMLAGCSDNYLELAPESSPSAASIKQSVSAARLAVRGIGRAMQCQYQEVSTANQYNGESYVNTIYGDAWGQDVIQKLAQTQFGATTYKWNTMGNMRATWVNNIPWNYPYGIIYMANGVLDGIDDAEGEAAERCFVKAQALTFRSHGYVKLLQFFAPRWEDSDNGEKYCIVIRTSQKTENVPLSKMIDVKNRIYEDLDSALANFDRAEGVSREYKWETDKSVAYGIYARAALLFHDWSKAQEMAHNARQGYTIMDNNTLFSGFCDDNNDFMWTQAAEESDIYYWSYGAHYTVNGLYVKNWGDIGAGAINLDLYNMLDPNDVRRGLFMTPDKLAPYATDKNMNPGGLVPADFFSEDLVNPANMDMNYGAFRRDSKNPKKKWGLYNFIVRWGTDYMNNTFKGPLDQCIDASDKFACYFAWGGSVEGMAYTATESAKLYGVQIGAQYKFWSYAPYGTSHYPYMRASEMCLAEAEAAYMAGDMATAKSCLAEINGIRIKNYPGAPSGQALLDEIKLCRRIELWGEGQSWTDFKRWNMPCVRRAWIKGDTDSGNFGKAYEMNRTPQSQGGWRFTVPAIESDFNPLIDRNLLPDLGEYTVL